MEKINRRPRTDVLAKGEAAIVYVSAKPTAAGGGATAAIEKAPSVAEEQPALPAAGATPREDSPPKKD